MEKHTETYLKIVSVFIVGFDDRAKCDAFEFPKEIELKTQLSDVIDLMGSKMLVIIILLKSIIFMINWMKRLLDTIEFINGGVDMCEENKSGVVPTLTANMGAGGNNVPLIRTNSGAIRKLTPKECFNVQGYLIDFKLPENVSNGQLYKQAGEQCCCSSCASDCGTNS